MNVTRLPLNDERILDSAYRVLAIEIEALVALRARLDQSFVQAVKMIYSCKGRVIVSGMGKSGHVAHKIASTFASTGTPAFFVHPAEALHGDLGMITRSDILLALSNSGQNEELLTLITPLKRHGGKIIALTGNLESPLAKRADVVLDGRVDQEACSLNLSPTASTTAALVIGDALAVALLDVRGFSTEDFARTHPAGALGRRLLTFVRDVMHVGKDIPLVREDAGVVEALQEMSRANLGMTAVIDAHEKVVGIFTDGDLRRALEKYGDLRPLGVRAVMTHNPHTIAPNHLAVEAVQMMENFHCGQLLVIENDKLVGALGMQDLLLHQVV